MNNSVAPPPLPVEFFTHHDESFANRTRDGNHTVATAATLAPGSQSYPMARPELTLTGYFMIGGFLLILALCLFVLIWNVWRQRRQRYLLSHGSGGASHALASRSIKQRIQRRYETVEHWIISKTVLEHTDFCSAVVADFDHHNQPSPMETTQGDTEATDETLEQPTANEETLTILVDTKADMEHVPTEPCCPLDDEDTEMQECPICMLELLPGEIVSWSANEQCCHVYHHECIKEWLLRNTQCCMCKATYLPVDEKQGKAKTMALNELSLQFAAAAATSYYCATSGLVRIPKTVRCTRQELYQLERRIFDGAVPPCKLVALRGSRPEGTATSCKSTRDLHFAASDNGTILPAHETHRDDSVQTDELTGSVDLNSSSFDNLSSDLNVSQAEGVSSTRCDDMATLDTLYHDMEVGSSSLLSLMERANQPQVADSNHESQTSCPRRQTIPPELISATEYLEQNSLTSYPDSRWCIQTSDSDDLESGGVEVQETTSAGIVDMNQE